VISAAYKLEDLKGPVRLEESLKDLRSLSDFLVPGRVEDLKGLPETEGRGEA
jgi:hypothetical protein